MQVDRSPDVARTTLQILALGTLIAGSFWVVRPFLVALTWAIMIVIATWPLFSRVQTALGGKRGPAVAAMTLALLLVLVVPLYFAIHAIVRNAERIADWSVATLVVAAPPAWLGSLPVVGSRLEALWHEIAAAGPEGLAARLSPVAHTLAVWFVGQVGNIGLLLVQFLLTVVIAAILYRSGEAAADGAGRFARRLMGPRGEDVLRLAAQAVRAVALGVVVTAIVQSGLSGIGLAIAGVPFVAVLTALMFVLGIAQVGATPVLVVAVIWVYATRGTAWGTGLLIWSTFCATLDNVLRPMLIRHGADLPLLLIFAGVLGGLIAFGVIGLFIGPVVLAIAYTLLVDWVSQDQNRDTVAGPEPTRT